jgi:hypothetical protein
MVSRKFEEERVDKKEMWQESLAWARAEVLRIANEREAYAKSLESDAGHARSARRPGGPPFAAWPLAVERGRELDAAADLWFQRASALRKLIEERPPLTTTRLARLADLLGLIVKELGVELAKHDSHPLSWSDGTGTTYIRILREAGVELVTEPAARRRGHVLRRGAEPVATKYFRAPIASPGALYVLDVQTRPAKKP